MAVELLRIIILYMFGGALYGWIVNSLYEQLNVEYGWLAIFISFLLISIVIYRNYLQFRGWYHGEEKKRLSKKVTVLFISIAVGLVILPIVLSSITEPLQGELYSKQVWQADNPQVDSDGEHKEQVEQLEDKKQETSQNHTAQVTVELWERSSWKEGEMFRTQIDGLVKNHSEDSINEWEVLIELPDKSQVVQSWNGDFSINGTTLHIKPVEYNRKVAEGQETGFGFIIATEGEFVPELYSVEFAAGDVRKRSKGIDIDDGAVPEVAMEAAINEDNNDVEAEIEEPVKTEKIDQVSGDTPFATHGKLSLRGTQIIDQHGNPYLLRGVSTHGIQWFGEYVNRQAFKTMRDQWGIDVVRLAVYSDPNAGYTKSLHSLIEQGVSYGTELGLYVIIDWHILSDGNPNQYKQEAIAFFDKMAAAYKDYDNIIYEICNEPNGDVQWSRDIKPYAEEVISAIRKHQQDALIIVGTPTWSQDVDQVVIDPIVGQKHIMYALHFYAATHKESLRLKATQALAGNLPIFVSEFGICDASGSGINDYQEADTWIRFLRERGISYVIWNLSNKNESSALLKSSVTRTSGWSEDDLSDSGKWFFNTSKVHR